MADFTWTCLNDDTVTYLESAYVETSFRQDGQTAVRHCQVAGADEEKFIRAMLGWTAYDGEFGLLLRFPPEPHPRKRWLFARSVDFIRELGEPSISGETGALQYAMIEIAVTYEATPGIIWLQDSLIPEGVTDHEAWRYLTYREEADIENRIIPRNRLLFDMATVVPVPEPGVQMVASSNLFIEWKQVPAILNPANNVLQLPGQLSSQHANCQGRINSKTFFGAAPLTLYCMAPKKELVTMADGNPAWNISYQLLRRGWSDYKDVAHPLGDAQANDTVTTGPNWSRLLQPEGNYRRVYRKMDPDDPLRVKSIYDTADLYNLFRVGTDGLVIGVG